MRISTQQMYLQGVGNIVDKQSNLATLQSQIGSGKRILTPADDPVAAAQVVTIGNAQSQIGQYQKNINMVTSNRRPVNNYHRSGRGLFLCRKKSPGTDSIPGFFWKARFQYRQWGGVSGQFCDFFPVCLQSAFYTRRLGQNTAGDEFGDAVFEPRMVVRRPGMRTDCPSIG